MMRRIAYSIVSVASVVVPLFVLGGLAMAFGPSAWGWFLSNFVYVYSSN